MEDISNTRYKLYQERGIVQAYLLSIDEAIDQFDQNLRNTNLLRKDLRQIENEVFQKHIKTVKDTE